MTKFRIFTQMFIVDIECDVHEQVFGGHRFVLGGKVIAEFVTCLGWVEVPEDKTQSATVLSLVPGSTPPSAA